MTSVTNCIIPLSGVQRQQFFAIYEQSLVDIKVLLTTGLTQSFEEIVTEINSTFLPTINSQIIALVGGWCHGGYIGLSEKETMIYTFNLNDNYGGTLNFTVVWTTANKFFTGSTAVPGIPPTIPNMIKTVSCSLVPAKTVEPMVFASNHLLFPEITAVTAQDGAVTKHRQPAASSASVVQVLVNKECSKSKKCYK